MGTLIGILISSLIGIKAISLGAKGFSQTGLLLTKERNITGRTAKAIGVVCILLGSLFMLATLGHVVALALS